MNQNTKSNPNITQLTTDELIRQGYPPETAAKHPANVANLAPAEPTSVEGVMPTVESATSPDLAVHEPEALPPVTQQNDEALGAVALATELVRPYNSNEQMVVDRRTGSRLTRQQFAELNSDPHTRL